MHSKELSVKGRKLSWLELSTSLGHVLMHDVLPLPLVICDHVHSRNEVLVEFTGRAGLWEPAQKVKMERIASNNEVLFRNSEDI